MNSTKKTILQISVIIAISVTVLSYWEFIQIHEHSELSEFYPLDHEYEGQNQVVSDVYGELSAPFLIKDTLIQDIIEQNGNNLKILSTVSSKNSETDEVLFYLENTYNVDSKTRLHLDKEGKLFAFPPGVEKKDYDFFHPAVFFDDPMVFKGTEVFHGLEVYVFEVVTKGADISEAFPQFTPHKIFTDTTSRFLVEPTTGNVLRVEKNWENYLVENGKRINTVEIGEKKTTEFIEHIFAEMTVNHMDHIYFNDFLLPIFILTMILIGGFIWILYTYFTRLTHEKHQLKEKEKIKDELVTMLGHEIKNPLTPIQMISELLLMEKDGPLTDKQRERVKIILDNSNILSELLTDFLDIKKFHLDQIKLSKTEVDLKEYLENAVESVRPFTEAKNIQFSLNLQKSWKIICDQKRISQVISNLVKNAIDFVPEGRGKIIISAELSKEGTIISVADNGIGIQSTHAEVIFDRFKQLESPLHIRHEGSGLGLSVCKEIVEAHGGRIWLDKSYDAGAKFQFLIP